MFNALVHGILSLNNYSPIVQY